MIGGDTYQIVIEIPRTEDQISKNDYRYSAIDISIFDNSEGIDLKELMGDNEEPLKAKFLGHGNVRLYREYEDSDVERFSLSESSQMDTLSQGQNIDGDETMLCIVAVPTYFTVTDLLGFIGEAFMKHITHIRILKSERPNRFLVLLKFNDLVKTAEFQFKFNGKHFNSMEPETCHIVNLRKVEVDASASIDNEDVNEITESLIPFLLDDPFTKAQKDGSDIQGTLSRSIGKSFIELPTCPVCLERMDSNITGLVTIPCQHTFHCQCLTKWKDDTCPICRYSNSKMNSNIRRNIRRQQVPHIEDISSPVAQGSSDQEEHCFDCQERNNLWVCLICGNVGCDRYAPDQHSLKHFIHTGHCFAMEINTSRVWDYAGDNYVHRLLANHDDGKIVELPDKETQGNSNGRNNWNPAQKSSNAESSFDKVDEVGFEYSQLLIEQLASQREYYESLLSKPNVNEEEPNISAIRELSNELKQLRTDFNDLQSNTIPSLKEKIKKKDLKIQELTRELNSVNSLNEGLSTKVEFLTGKKDNLDEQCKDLQDQVKDLMFYLESQEKFKNESQEVRDGTVIIQDSAPARLRKSRKARKK